MLSFDTENLQMNHHNIIITAAAVCNAELVVKVLTKLFLNLNVYR